MISSGFFFVEKKKNSKYRQIKKEIIMNKKNYILGLDLGVGSVGWSCVELDSEHEPKRIIAANSRIFPSENGSMEDRRNARELRRTLRRRKARIKKTKNLFVKYNLLTKEELKTFFTNKVNKFDNPYQIKVKGLNNPLTKEELLIALVHYSKYRGFKSNRKNKEEASNAS